MYWKIRIQFLISVCNKQYKHSLVIIFKEELSKKTPFALRFFLLYFNVKADIEHSFSYIQVFF